MQQPTSYKDAGVDIGAGNALVERIKPLAKATARSGVMGGIGGFGALFDLKATGYKDPLLVSTTDGVGTKLKIAQALKKHDTIGIDLVAMCVNDLIVQGAEPLFFLDYFATGRLAVEEAASIIQGIAQGCNQAGCALSGGETAEMPGMYADGEYDLAGFAVGIVERDRLLPKGDISEGDMVLGLASSGLHSNGYSLVRHLVERGGHDYGAPAPFAPGTTLGDVLLTPTRIYVKSILSALKSEAGVGIKALAHITGGGLSENIPRVLPDHLAAQLNPAAWELPLVFGWLQTIGHIENAELWRTFNCGIGMALIVEARNADTVAERLKAEGEKVFRIGSLVPRRGDAVVINRV